jgi:hypothetical protein
MIALEAVAAASKAVLDAGTMIYVLNVSSGMTLPTGKISKVNSATYFRLWLRHRTIRIKTYG